MASIDPHEVAALDRQIRASGIINRVLVQICVSEGMSKGGNKADLQQRIIERLHKHVRSGDVLAFNRLKNMINNPSSLDQPTSSPFRTMNASASSAVNSPATPASYLGTPNHSAAAYNMGGPLASYRIVGNPRIEFKSSPYYVIEEQLGGPTQCDVMTHHRHTVKVSLRSQDYPILSRVHTDPTLKVMVFCAAEGQGRQDISFPHQSEIKVNGGEVKANLRGLKNKPGSTRPVDITKELRYNPISYLNSVEMTYALTNKKFYLVVYVVKSVPVADLVKRLETGKRITEKSVLDDMANKARDADIVTTASVLSLKCPLSTLRISLPIRSISCRHNQCFDATSYLQLQEQGPTWLCPICNNPASFDNLAVDEYVNMILKGTSKPIDQVTIQPDGKWELNSKKEQPKPSPKPNNVNGFASDSDDDIVEITKSGEAVKMGSLSRKTPNGGSSLSRESSVRESSGAPKNPGSTSAKRPISAVIDLTSSGDEEEEPERPQKRIFGANGYSLPQHPPPFNPYAPP